MAVGDITVFDEAKLALLDGTHDLDTHAFKCALLENTTVPAAGDLTPALADYTQVTAAGSYTSGGTAVTVSLTEAAGTVTFDLTTNPTWVKNASNTTTCYWALIYNDTNVGKEAICFVDLAGAVDMTAGDLTITWNASGVFTLA